MKNLHLSASSIGSFKACPRRNQYKYFDRLVPIESSESQRVGTNWHELQEILGQNPGAVCKHCGPKSENDPDCAWCHGEGFLGEDLMAVAINTLDKRYETTPTWAEPDKWELEKIILSYSLAGYNWRYSEDLGHEVIATEMRFDMPLRALTNNRALPFVKKVGVIDKIIRQPNGLLYVADYKSTSKGIDSDSSFWAHLRLDTQINMYISAAREMQLSGELAPYGVKPDEPLIAGMLYDVWHKPTIKPKMLTQGDSKKFVADGQYCGQEFRVSYDVFDSAVTGGNITVNGVQAETKVGAKEGTFAIRETPEMYGARLLQDIGGRPDFYFARREISRSDNDIAEFERELHSIYRSIRFMEKQNAFFRNEQQCEATFKCSYLDLCYNNVKLDKENAPDGFKFI